MEYISLKNPKNLGDLFFYKGIAVEIRKELEDGKYQISRLQAVHYTELEHPSLIKPIDMIIDDTKALMYMAVHHYQGSPIVDLIQQALKLMIDIKDTG